MLAIELIRQLQAQVKILGEDMKVQIWQPESGDFFEVGHLQTDDFTIYLRAEKEDA